MPDKTEYNAPQCIITSALDLAEVAELSTDSPSAKRRIRSASGQYAAIAFTTLPTSREFVLSNSEISCAVKIRLGLNQFSDARSWCNYSPVDPSHFDSCVSSAGLRTMRHDAITGVQAVRSFVTLEIENVLNLRFSQERRLIKLILLSLTLVLILLMTYKFKNSEQSKVKKHQDAVITLVEFSTHSSCLHSAQRLGILGSC